MVYGASAVDEVIDDATVEWRDVPNGGVSGDDVEVSREQVGSEGGVSPRHRVEQTVVSHHLPLHSTTRVDGREGWQTEKRQSRQEDTMPMHCQYGNANGHSTELSRLIARYFVLCHPWFPLRLGPRLLALGWKFSS